MLNEIDRFLDDLNESEKAEAIKILNELSNTGESESLLALYDEDYEEIPVDIDEFIESDLYVGKTTDNGKAIYPYWRKELRDMFEDPNKYQEIALTGSIGTGKSTIACYGMVYLLYKTMCLRDPQKYYRLAAGSNIVFAFFNNTLDLVSSVGYNTVQNIVQNSPWFLERGKISGVKNLEYIPDKLIRFRVGSTAGHALGTNIISAMLDEVSFKQGANVQMEKSKIMETYNGVLERMGSRFMVNGKVAGKLFIVSSKKSEYDFLESYIRKQKGKPGVKVCDARLWEVKPTQTYSGRTFLVALGGSNRKSIIIPDNNIDYDIIFNDGSSNTYKYNDDIEVNNNEIIKTQDLKLGNKYNLISEIKKTSYEYMRQGFEILEVPEEFRNRFEMDIQAALMNIAGISISNSTRFISYDNLVKCYRESKNPFSINIITTGMGDKLRLIDFFDKSLVPSEIYSRPIFIHLDLSLTGDRTGISAVAVMGYKNVNEYSIESGEVETTKELFYHHIFSIGIQCPSSDEISLQKTRDFIYYLRYVLNWNIWGISADGYQSRDTLQQLRTMGFAHVDLVSLDRSPDGYITYKQAINEKRISHLNIPELEFEVINLARDNMTGKIDHDVDKCFTGDTKIKLVDGRDLTILELLAEQDYKTNWVYTFNEEKRIIEPKRIKKVFQTMITKDLVRITLDNNEVITCTPNHKFMLRDGSYEIAKNLKENTSLMPLYTKISEKGLVGYKLYYEPMEDLWHYEHRRFCNNLINKKGYVVHHCNYNKLDNTPSNLKCITRSEHTIIHNNNTLDYDKISKSELEWYSKYKNTRSFRDRIEKSAKTRVINSGLKEPKYITEIRINNERIKEIERIYNVVYSELNSHDKRMYGIRYNRLMHPETTKLIASKVSDNHKLGLYKNIQKTITQKMWITDGVNNKFVFKTDEIPDGWYKGRVLSEKTKLRMKESFNRPEYKINKSKIVKEQSSNRYWVTNGINNKFIKRDEDIPEGYREGRVRNHSVVSIEFITKPCRVYDIEVEDNHNFALSAGVIVHNSKDISDSLAGAIYNASIHEQELNLNASDEFELINTINSDDNDDTKDIDKLLGSLVSGVNKIDDISKVEVPMSQSEYDSSGFFFL